MEYQPLDAARNELRLISFTQDRDTLLSSTSDDQYPPDMIRLNMKTVSLDDYTEISQEVMKASGKTTCQAAEYVEHMRSKSETWNTEDLQNSSFNDTTAAQAALFSDPAFGRWIWGDFVALSYTWGDGTRIRPILVNGHQMQVTENLEEYLRSSVMTIVGVDFETEAKRFFWIDAICINQHDIKERNLQVKRMGAIYSLAMFTFTWLGPSNDGKIQLALRFLFYFTTKILDRRQQETNYFALISGLLQNTPETGTWTAIERLFTCPYWSRLWIVQEIGLSRERIQVTYGAYAIPWKFLLAAIPIFRRLTKQILILIHKENHALGLPPRSSSRFEESLNRVEQLGAFVYSDLAGRPLIFHKLLSIVRHSQSRDPVDKVYGILSLIDSKLAAMITPDYALSPSVVFCQFVAAVVKWSGSIDVITAQGRRIAERGIPSWVPDWSESVTVQVELTVMAPFHPSGVTKAIYNIHEDRLEVQGFVIEHIDGLGVPWPVEHSHDDMRDRLVQPTTNQTCYNDETGVRNALWRTLCCDRGPAGGSDPTSDTTLLDLPWPEDEDNYVSANPFYADFHEFRKANSEFQIAGKAFKSYFPTGTDEEEAINMNEFYPIDPLQGLFRAIHGRRLIITEQGYIGLARNETQKGDIVCVLFGASVPMILRPREDGVSYTFVGDAYIHGFMEGEAMVSYESGNYVSTEFAIY